MWYCLTSSIKIPEILLPKTVPLGVPEGQTSTLVQVWERFIEITLTKSPELHIQLNYKGSQPVPL
ncbi:hypothetical protein [Nostoc sp.]|uniref:hypothetical protein n=1 Tax=Nostoc sp. TaxID=1180 RepID=UPI002FFB8EFD